MSPSFSVRLIIPALSPFALSNSNIPIGQNQQKKKNVVENVFYCLNRRSSPSHLFLAILPAGLYWIEVFVVSMNMFFCISFFSFCHGYFRNKTNISSWIYAIPSSKTFIQQYIWAIIFFLPRCIYQPISMVQKLTPWFQQPS